jgi:hypothetical protein
MQLPFELYSLILSQYIENVLSQIPHDSFCFCCYNSEKCCSRNLAAAELRNLAKALPLALREELHHICHQRAEKLKHVENLWHQFFWWTWAKNGQAMRPCCKSGVTEEMLHAYIELLVLKQYVHEVGFVHDDVVAQYGTDGGSLLGQSNEVVVKGRVVDTGPNHTRSKDPVHTSRTAAAAPERDVWEHARHYLVSIE